MSCKPNKGYSKVVLDWCTAAVVFMVNVGLHEEQQRLIVSVDDSLLNMCLNLHVTIQLCKSTKRSKLQRSSSTDMYTKKIYRSLFFPRLSHYN